MTKRKWLAWAGVLAALGCGSYTAVNIGDPVGEILPTQETPVPNNQAPEPEDPGSSPGDTISIGNPVPTDQPPATDPGPWPTEPVRNYTADFGLGKPQSVALDEGFNLWLLDGERIGVLRPGDTAPKWTSRIGQA